MNRLELVQKVIALSGRYDLVQPDPTNGHEFGDNGIDFFVNDAQLYMDLFTDLQYKSWHYSKPVSGTYIIELEKYRKIEAVWYADTESRNEAVERSLKYVRDTYTTPIDSSDVGAPAEFCKIPVNVAPSLLETTVVSFANLVDWGQLHQNDAKFQLGGAYTGILLIPPTDGTYTIEILGQFYSPDLIDDASSSLWSSRYPSILAKGTMMSMEGLLRNSEGVNDFKRLVDQMLLAVEADASEDDPGYTNQQESSWVNF